MCAAYFVKVYCNSRDIPTENIRLSQNNIVDPENRYNQIFQIQVELPESVSEKDRLGIYAFYRSLYGEKGGTNRP